MPHLKWNSSGMFNGPGVAGAVLQTAFSLIHLLSESSFSSRPSKNHNSQTVRARELKFSDIVHHPLCVTFRMSCVKCHISCVTCHVSHVTKKIFSLTIWWSKLLEGLLLTRPTSSSFSIFIKSAQGWFSLVVVMSVCLFVCVCLCPTVIDLLWRPNG